MRRNQWTIGLTGPERLRGWIFFALYVIAFPFLMAWVQRSFPTEWPVAEANVVYYLLVAVLLFLLLWSFLRENFSLLLDWLVIIHGLLIGLWLTSNHLSLHLFYGRSVNRRHAVIQLVNADNVLRRLTVAH